MWAVRKVGTLLDDIRLHGERPELRDEVVVLARHFGIVTPYTSFLVTPDEPGLDWALAPAEGASVADCASAPQAPSRSAATAADAPLRESQSEIDALYKLAERRGTAILLVHHTRKGFGNESGLDSVSGTSGITAAADAVWTLKREDQGLSTLEVVGRECEEQSIGMKFRDGGVGWEFIGDGNQVRGMKDNA